MTLYKRGKTRAVILLNICVASVGILAYTYYGGSFTMPTQNSVQQAVATAIDKVTPTSASSPIGEGQIPDMLERSLKSVFKIEASSDKGKGLGSGFLVVIDGRRFIFTNAHVVRKATSIKVTAMNGVEVPAKLLKANDQKDVAILETEEVLPGLTIAEKARVGETVYAIGNPAGYIGTVTQGIIGYIDRKVGEKTLLQHSAETNPGNSGGALVNSHGEVMGINSGTLKGGKQERMVGMHVAVPMNSALEELSGL